MTLQLVKTPTTQILEINTPGERRSLLVALELYGQACIEAIRLHAHDEDKRLEFAARYDEAKTLAERAAGL